MERKDCTNCKIEKDIINFSKKNKLKDGTQRYQPICKDCFNAKDSERRKTKEYKEYKPKYDKKYYNENTEKILEHKKEYHLNNKEEILSKKKEYRDNPKNKERTNIYSKEYRDNPKNKDKIYKYRRINPHIIAWRRNLHRTLTYLKQNKETSTTEILGYTATQLKEHLEKQFNNGMTWDNYGVWEIDHIKPLTSFNIDSSISEVNALSNLRPLWMTENRKKYNNLI